MASKTNTERIDDLSSLAATLTERVDNTREDVVRLEAANTRATEALSEVSTQITRLEHQVGDLRKAAELSGKRWWSLLLVLVGAVIGGMLTILAQYLQR
jgi:predicted  nucleic acid-binding Zn-ribbon protein